MPGIPKAALIRIHLLAYCIACANILAGFAHVAMAQKDAGDAQQPALGAIVRLEYANRNLSGSGIIIGCEGRFVYILTARHLIQGHELPILRWFLANEGMEATGTLEEVEVVAVSDDLRDLALLRAVGRPAGLPRIRIGWGSSPPNGLPEGTIALGCPGGKPPQVQLSVEGVARKVRRQPHDEPAVFWEVTPGLLPGFSGGALVDAADQNLLGVCSGTSKGKAYFCHSEEIHRFLARNRVQYLLEEQAHPRRARWARPGW